MPKVSEQHLEARRQQIVDAAAACFARRGFHQTTMHDICQAAELSPGAVYRYFDSKTDIIRAMVSERQVQGMKKVMAAARPGRPTLQVLDELISGFFPLVENIEGCVLDIELWAEATHDPEIRRLLYDIQAEMVIVFTAILARGQERGEINPGIDARAAGEVMVSLFHGLIQQKAVDPALNIGEYIRVMRAMMSGSFWVGEKEV